MLDMLKSGEVREAISWRENTIVTTVYWGARAVRLQDFKNELMNKLVRDFPDYRFRAIVLRPAANIGSFTINKSTGYVFVVTKSIRD